MRATGTAKWGGRVRSKRHRSHGRFGMVPFVYVRVELMAARRAMRRLKQPREGRPCRFPRVRDQISALEKIGINKLLSIN